MWLHSGSWKKTAALCSLIANCNRDPKKKREPFTPNDFDPTIRRPKVEHITISFDQFAAAMGVKGA